MGDVIESFTYHEPSGEPMGQCDIFSSITYMRLFHSDNIHIDLYRDIIGAIRGAEEITRKNTRARIIKEIQERTT